MMKILIVIILIMLVICNNSFADDGSEIYTYATPVILEEPRWPKKAMVEGIEGRVLLCFTIMPNGNVDNVVVKRYSPDLLFVEAAQRAIQKSKFRPTVVDGVAIKQDNVCYRMDFILVK